MHYVFSTYLLAYCYFDFRSTIYCKAVATFTASRKHSPTTIFTAIINYSMYARTCTLLLTYPTQTPLLFAGSRLDRQCFLRFICAHGVAVDDRTDKKIK